MLPDVRHQGSPLELVEARGATYADFVVGITSTPSRGIVEAARDPQSGLDFWQVADAGDLESPIWTLWQSGTRHHWCWPCVHCGQFFVPRFSLLRWPEGATPAEARRAAFIECLNCGGVIEERHKTEMNRRGRYVAPGQTITADGAVSGDPVDVSTMSFWVSGLCSPFVTFGQRAEQHLTAVAMVDTDRIPHHDQRRIWRALQPWNWRDAGMVQGARALWRLPARRGAGPCASLGPHL